MSLNGALNNAFSGLRANARAASLVSTNISNATTEGYGRRILAQSPNVDSSYGGVRIDGVTRISDPIIIADRRLSDASLGQDSTMFAYAKNMETAIGGVDQTGSLQSMLTDFENSLLTASSNPASTQRLDGVANSADRLTKGLNTLSGRIQQERLDADGRIGFDVENLNDSLKRIEALNDDISRGGSRGGDVSSLLDERQRIVDGIADIVPLRVVPRDRGEIAIFTTSGGTLLDGRRTEFGFANAQSMAPDLNFADGDLSGLTVDGRPANPSLFGGGTLAANFEIRDSQAPSDQAKLDGVARDMIERLGAGGPDTTIAVGDPGFFTDAGVVFDPLNETGLANRIALNDAIRPSNGETWRIRDGLNAIAQGEVGESRLILSMSAALENRQAPASTSLDPVSRSLDRQMSEFVSTIAAFRVRSEDSQAYTTAQNTALKELEFSKGVDTDQELQRLIQIEQNYAANAQVMTAVDEMLQRLLNI